MERTFGVDIAKDWSDVACPDGQERFANADLAPLRQGRPGKAIRIDPRRARAFATSPGRLARSDRVSAAVTRKLLVILNAMVRENRPYAAA